MLCCLSVSRGWACLLPRGGTPRLPHQRSQRSKGLLSSAPAGLLLGVRAWGCPPTLTVLLKAGGLPPEPLRLTPSPSWVLTLLSALTREGLTPVWGKG